MKLFFCQQCGQAIMFENMICERCGHRIGYLPERRVLSAVEPDGCCWTALAEPHERYRFCANWELRGCNWMIRVGENSVFCAACQHNRTIPDISDEVNHMRWVKIEASKRRLIYSLISLGLPLPTPASGDPEPLVFDFLSDPPHASAAPKVMTGHDNGLITLSLAEADDALREKTRISMGEPYRTLLGHFRHEVGHYYWDKLVRDGGNIESCRALFGDDSEDYDAALQRRYANGAPNGWQENFVSAYAAVHPWEDFAETFAHYLHIVDTLETANAFGVHVAPKAYDSPKLQAGVDFDPYHPVSVEALIGAWLPLTFAVNGINRSMGQPDLYPFVLSAPAIAKLGYIDRLAHGRIGKIEEGENEPPTKVTGDPGGSRPARESALTQAD